MAMLRFSRVSRARYTSPMPAAAAGGTISYGPSFVPEAQSSVRAIIIRCGGPRWTLRLWVGRQPLIGKVRFARHPPLKAASAKGIAK